MTRGARWGWVCGLPIGIAVVLTLIVLATVWLVGTQSGLRVAVSLAHRVAPDLIEIGEARGRIVGPLSLSGLKLRLPTLKASVSKVDLDWRALKIFTGSVHVDSLLVSGIDIELLPSDEQGESDQALEFPETLTPPFDVQINKLLLADLQFDSGDASIEVTQARAAASWIATEIELRRLEVTGPSFDAVASARVDARKNYPLSGRLNVQVKFPGYAKLSSELLLSGDLNNPVLGLDIAPPYNTTVDVTLSELLGTPRLHATLSSKPEQLDQLSDALPAEVHGVSPVISLAATGPLDNLVTEGQLAITGEDIPQAHANFQIFVRNTGIEISDLVAQVEGQPQPVVVSGALDFEGQQPANVRVSWPELAFSIGADTLRASKGLLELTGNLQRYSFSGHTQVDYLGQTNPIALSGSGTQSGIKLATLHVGLGGGGLTAKTKANWSNGLTAEVNLHGQKVNPGLYVRELVGALDLELRLAVQQTHAGVLAANLTDLRVSGDLVDLPVNASGGVSYAAGELEAQTIQVQFGANRLAMDGNLGEQSDFQWSLAALELSQLSQIVGVELAGKVQGEGTFSGKYANPEITVALHAESVIAAGLETERVELTLDGARRDHRYVMQFESPQVDLALEGSGDLKADKTWLYSLNNLRVSHPDLDRSRPRHEWALTEITVGRLSADIIEVQPLCLQHRLPKEGGAICVSASQPPGGALQTHVGLDALQLDNLNVVLPEGIRLEGILAGEASWFGEVVRTRAQLSLEGIALALNEGEKWQDAMVFSPGTIVIAPRSAVDTDTGKCCLHLDVSLPLADDLDNSGIFAQATLTPSADISAARWPIESSLTIKLPDLSWLAFFTDQLDSFNGALEGGLELGGTLGSPELEGSTVFTAPSTALSGLGIDLRDTQIALEGTMDGLKLRGSMRSGEGELTLAGNIDWKEDIQIEGTVSGANFLISDSSLARAIVSPDLRAEFSNNKLLLRGEVAIPLADVQLAKVPNGAVTASRDQQFIEQTETPVPLDLDAEIRVRLGEEISFEGLGLEASFGGELTVSEKSTGTTTGRGEIQIREGTYKAYGQDLTVENGKVIFAGGPIEEPGLDIRAVRQATTDVSVGVLVQGSLLRPRLEVFSTPSMPQSDQLSYLVLGRPLSASSESENSLLQQAAMAIGVEGGTLFTDKIGENLGVDSIGIESEPGTGAAQAALVVGKYLSPRLYVSYGYGLFEPISTLRMEYQLSRWWRIVTQSTNEATGGDILWVQER